MNSGNLVNGDSIFVEEECACINCGLTIQSGDVCSGCGDSSYAKSKKYEGKSLIEKVFTANSDEQYIGRFLKFRDLKVNVNILNKELTKLREKSYLINLDIVMKLVNKVMGDFE